MQTFPFAFTGSLRMKPANHAEKCLHLMRKHQLMHDYMGNIKSDNPREQIIPISLQGKEISFSGFFFF